MIPIRDHNPATTRPFVTYALLAANIAVFLWYVPLFADPYALFAFFEIWAVIPARLSDGYGAYTLVSSLFLHGGWLHLIGNMVFLYIFGDNVEDQLGHGGFAAFYLASGMGAGLLQVAMAPGSTVPMVGASGAIAGVMGAYLLMFPRARIDLFLFLIVIIRIIPVPAWLMLGLWFGFQLLGGAASPADAGGVAHWAHVGGFVVGMVLMVPVWLRRGGPAFWAHHHGAPAHPEARYRLARTHVPRVTRARRHNRPGPWSPPPRR